MERFWTKVSKSSDPDGCWEFVGLSGKRRSDYAPFSYQGRIMAAHRVSWTLEHGEIPTGMCVCHHCDNRRCVRPDHLFLGTAKDNMQDMVKKGRATKANRGSGNGMAKLTEEQVYEIREVCRYGDLKRLGEKFGVSKSSMYEIRTRKTWGWLPEREKPAG